MDNKYNYFTSNNKVYMIIIAVLILMLILYEDKKIIGIIAVCLYIFLIIYNIKNTRSRKNKWKKFIENFPQNLIWLPEVLS